MRYRVFLVVITLFFGSMNVLLWRAEFGARTSAGTLVPPEVVWGKVLTSPDSSDLDIHHRGTPVGHVHWIASVSEDPVVDPSAVEDPPPEGMIKEVTGYSLDFDGYIKLAAATRLRFGFTLKLDANQAWQDLAIKVGVKPYSWKIHAAAATQTASFLTEDDEERKERTYTFAELRTPDKILRDLAGPDLSAAIATLRLSLPRIGSAAAGPALQWEARHDRLRVGSNFIRVYRLEVRLLEGLKAVVFVSPVGEILRLELPEGIVLTNDALTTL